MLAAPRGRQDRDRAGARRNAVRRRAEPHHHQHERVPGGAHGLHAQGRASRIRRLREAGCSPRGATPAYSVCSSTRSRRPIPTCTRSSSRCSTRLDGGRRGPVIDFKNTLILLTQRRHRPDRRPVQDPSSCPIRGHRQGAPRAALKCSPRRCSAGWWSSVLPAQRRDDRPDARCSWGASRSGSPPAQAAVLVRGRGRPAHRQPLHRVESGGRMIDAILQHGASRDQRGVPAAHDGRPRHVRVHVKVEGGSSPTTSTERFRRRPASVWTPRRSGYPWRTVSPPDIPQEETDGAPRSAVLVAVALLLATASLVGGAAAWRRPPQRRAGRRERRARGLRAGSPALRARAAFGRGARALRGGAERSRRPARAAAPGARHLATIRLGQNRNGQAREALLQCWRGIRPALEQPQRLPRPIRKLFYHLRDSVCTRSAPR